MPVCAVSLQALLHEPQLAGQRFWMFCECWLFSQYLLRLRHLPCESTQGLPGFADDTAGLFDSPSATAFAAAFAPAAAASAGRPSFFAAVKAFDTAFAAFAASAAGLPSMIASPALDAAVSAAAAGRPASAAFAYASAAAPPAISARVHEEPSSSASSATLAPASPAAADSPRLRASLRTCVAAADFEFAFFRADIDTEHSPAHVVFCIVDINLQDFVFPHCFDRSSHWQPLPEISLFRHACSHSVEVAEVHCLPSCVEEHECAFLSRQVVFEMFANAANSGRSTGVPF
jgi:hypothetical protein